MPRRIRPSRFWRSLAIVAGLSIWIAPAAMALPSGGHDAGHGAEVHFAQGRTGGFDLDLRSSEPVLLPSAGGSCLVVSLPGQPRRDDPLATSYGWLIGVPERGGAVVSVVEVAEHRLKLARPLCAASPGRRRREDLIPDSAPIARLEDVGMLRGQPVARLVVQALARSGDEIIVRSKLRLRVDYCRPESIADAPRDPGPFGGVKDVLLNHDHLPMRRGARREGGVGDSDLADTTIVTSAAGPTAAAADPLALKVVVNRDGPLMVSGADLARAGWDLAAVDPLSVTLTHEDRAVGRLITGLVAGRLAPTSRLLFVGRAMTGQYTRDNVYWLRQSGQPIDISERTASSAPAAAARAFRATQHFEEDTRWLASKRPAEGDDRWMWGDALDAANPARRALTVSLAIASLGPDLAPARLRVRLLGYSDDPAVAPDHHVRLLLNDRPLVEARFDGRRVHDLAFDVPAGWLVGGENRLAVQTLGDTGALVDQLFLDWADLDYAAGYAADGGRLEFEPPAEAGVFSYTLTDFTDPGVVVLDITDPAAPVSLAGVTIAPGQGGRFTVRFTDAAAPGRRYLAFGADRVPAPAGIVRNEPSSLRAADNGADYIVITHPSFAAALAPLVDRRASQGLRTRVVRVDDVYDEFSGGVFDPRAIRAFLQHAYRHWAAPAPTFVLLVGEANLDYRGAYQEGPPNFLPTVMLDTKDDDVALTAYDSDQWYAAVDGDDPLPDMLVGRFSVSYVDEARTVVQKTLRYEDQPADAPWRRGAVMIVDGTDPGSFEPFSEHLAQRMPVDTDVRRIYVDRYAAGQPLQQDIVAAVDRGALVMNYVGHGNVAYWSPWRFGGFIFDNSAIGRLNNGDAMPVFTTATCMNGWISNPGFATSMAEFWLTHAAGGGAVAWSPSGYATLGAQRPMFERVYDGFFDGRRQPIGALTAAAGVAALGQSADWLDVVRMFVLVGDPAVVVAGAPSRAAPTATAAPTAVPTERPRPQIWLPWASADG